VIRKNIDPENSDQENTDQENYWLIRKITDPENCQNANQENADQDNYGSEKATWPCPGGEVGMDPSELMAARSLLQKAQAQVMRPQRII